MGTYSKGRDLFEGGAYNFFLSSWLYSSENFSTNKQFLLCYKHTQYDVFKGEAIFR